jgi:competence protein ComEA
MKVRNRLNRILWGAGLALALALVPSTWASSPAPQKAKSNSMSAMGSQTGQLDINTATESQLKALPGVGDVYAKRIISNRPYSSKDQLVRKGVLPQGVYDKIKSRIIAHRIGDALPTSRK